jgi:hypothetical protein
MRRARPSRPEIAYKENQRRSDQAGAAQQPETIEKAEKCRLLLDHSCQLRFRVQGRVRSRETVRHEISRQGGKRFLIAALERSRVSD